jgi:chromosomal replication initiator protein
VRESAQILWKKCLEIIRDNISEQQFSTWFSCTDALSFENDELTLAVPNRFVCEILEERYLDLIKKCINRVVGKDIRLKYSVLVDKQNGLSCKEESKNQSVVLRPSVVSRILPPEETLPVPVVSDFDSQLKLSYNFDNYIEGDSNKLARSVGKSIADKPAKVFNPFFIYGASGVGKTHLVNAIGLEIKKLHPNLRVLYVSAHLFMVQYVHAKLNNKTNEFINFYQTIDVLIIDDIQELSNKEKTQNTFFHIFNHLHLNGKQIILTADRSPVHIVGLEERLLTRFKWGLQAEIEKPTRALRYSILANKVKKEGLNIPEDVIGYIADHVNESIRDLEGVVNSLIANSIVLDCDIDLDLVNKVLPQFVTENIEPPTLDKIKDVVCEHFGITVDELCSRSRKHPIAYIRQLAIYLANKYTGMSSVQIGKQIGGRNHATVIHSINQIKNLIDVDDQVRNEIVLVEERVKFRRV